MNIPDDLFYSKDHEWVSMDIDSATVGITEHATEQLGDITVSLIYVSPVELILLKFKMTLAIGVIAAIPIILYIVYKALLHGCSLLISFHAPTISHVSLC